MEEELGTATGGDECPECVVCHLVGKIRYRRRYDRTVHLTDMYRMMYYNRNMSKPNLPTVSAIIQDSRLTLSDLHRRSGVSRTTLSRITNGRQAMSRRTAEKLAPILGVSAEQMLQTPSTQPAAPEILRISALQINQWGKTRRAEEELPELVSRLVRSELFSSGFIRAPSDERIFEPGQDIAVTAPRKTRHIPEGRSVWEVSTSKHVQRKATNDLTRFRVPGGWRRDSTAFVFVTTESWAGAHEWAYQQHAKDGWRSIHVLDATDLQAWIQESLGVQLWLMNRMRLQSDGFQWLREAVCEWSSVADPPLESDLLKASVEKHLTDWRDWVRAAPDRPLTIIGESLGEALLLIQALIERGHSDLPGTPIEGLCVSTMEGIRQLAASPPSDVIVIPTNERVRELAVACCRSLRVALPTTGQPRVSDPLVIAPVGRTLLQKFLVENGCDRGRAIQLARSCGGSVSVLRRLTHKDWEGAPDFQLPNRLSPILAAAGLFGIWDAGSAADRSTVLRLTGLRCNNDIEEAWTELLDLPETPVWMDGERRGVNSRLDTWQRFTERKITPQAMDRYFDAVSSALQAAPLARPGETFLLPMAYQALRDSQISVELLRGLAQGLVLLAEFGDRINRRLVGPPVSKRVQKVVFVALQDMTVERLRAMHTVMPLLAEAAPEAFLAAMEADLNQADSAQKEILNYRLPGSPAESVGQLPYSTDAVSYRSSLIRAYETLAWFPEHAERAIELLAQLADTRVLDHHGGRPRYSLVELLKPWHRGSVLDSERHCTVLRKLAKEHPGWALELVRKCLPASHDVADAPNLPLWRGQPDGAGTVRPKEHQTAVYRTAADILVESAGTSESAVYAAIDSVDNLPENEAGRVWERVGRWACSQGRNGEERIRLARRLTALADGAPIGIFREDNREAALRVLEKLSEFPVPAVWLFDDNATIWGCRPEDASWEVTVERLERKRRSALQRLRESGGIEAILSLVPRVRNAFVLGKVASHVLSTDEIHLTAGKALKAGGDAAHSPMRSFIQGLLDGTDEPDADALMAVIGSSSFADCNANWRPCLLVCLPLDLGAAGADRLSGEMLQEYWKQFDSWWQVIPPQRKDWLIAGLCSVGRPQAALLALRGDFEEARTESLQLLINALPQSKERTQRHWELRHWERELVAAIRKRPDLSPADAARIEFTFFEVLKPAEMPALARAVANDPSWLQRAMMLCMRRRDHTEDSPEWRARTKDAPDWLRTRAYRLFEWLPRLPGTTSSGYDVKRGLDWTAAILSFAEEHDRREVAEDLLGRAFGSAGFHEDGSPTDELTELLEGVQCPRVESGVASAASNKMGVEILPDGDPGGPYRDREKFYWELEQRYRDSAPRTARVMRLLKRGFADQAQVADHYSRLEERRDAQA